MIVETILTKNYCEQGLYTEDILSGLGIFLLLVLMFFILLSCMLGPFKKTIYTKFFGNLHTLSLFGLGLTHFVAFGEDKC